MHKVSLLSLLPSTLTDIVYNSNHIMHKFMKLNTYEFEKNFREGKCQESFIINSSGFNFSTAELITGIELSIKDFRASSERYYLYIVDDKTFKVYTYSYESLSNFLYDFFNLKEQNFFYKFSCPGNSVYYGFLDKLNLISFLNVITPINEIKYKVFENTFSILLNYIFSFHPYISVFQNMAIPENGDLELCRPFCNLSIKNDESFRLQIIGKVILPSYSKSSIRSYLTRYLKDKLINLLRVKTTRMVRFQKFNFDDSRDWQELIERNMPPMRDSKFLDYAIFEKDVSYYIYLWLSVFRLKSFKKGLAVPFLKEREDKMKTLFKSIKFLERNKRITMFLKDNITKYGILFRKE